jgi:hypothetical protein
MPPAEGKLIGGETAVLAAEHERCTVSGQVCPDLPHDFFRAEYLLAVLPMATGGCHGKLRIGQGILKRWKHPGRLQKVLCRDGKLECFGMVNGTPLHNAKL